MTFSFLLKEIIKNTPEDAKDYQNLTAAFDKVINFPFLSNIRCSVISVENNAIFQINAVVGDINEAQRNWEGLQHIIELQNKIEGCPVSNFFFSFGKYLGILGVHNSTVIVVLILTHTVRLFSFCPFFVLSCLSFSLSEILRVSYLVLLISA